MIIPWFFILGMVVYPPYIGILSDLVTGELMGVIFSLTRILEIVMQNLVSLVLKNQISGQAKDKSIYYQMSIGFALVSFVGAAVVIVFFFETGGLSKVEINERLNSKKNTQAYKKKEGSVDGKLNRTEDNFLKVNKIDVKVDN